MKRWIVALGILGLVWTAMPAANAAVCLQENFDGEKFEGVGGVYMQGLGGRQREDPEFPPFMVEGGFLRSTPEGDTFGSDAVSGENDPPGVRFLLLTGDPSWSNVTVTSRIMIDNQGTGSVGLVLRAAPKTKVEDPNSWYEFRYTTGLPPVLPDEDESGIEQNVDPPSLRIMKVVNGKWTMLAETDVSRNESIPNIGNAGDLAGEAVTFRFKATGSLLEGFISLDGTNFTKVIEANDDELKAGRIGVTHYDYSPLFDNLVVECE